MIHVHVEVVKNTKNVVVDKQSERRRICGALFKTKLKNLLFILPNRFVVFLNQISRTFFGVKEFLTTV